MIFYYMPLLMASLISILTFSKGKNTSRVSKIWEFLALALGFAFVTFMLINKDTLSMNFGYTFLAVAFVCQYCTGNFRKAQNRKSIVTPRTSYVLLSLMWIFLLTISFVIFILEYKYYYIDPMYKLSFGVKSINIAFFILILIGFCCYAKCEEIE